MSTPNIRESILRCVIVKFLIKYWGKIMLLNNRSIKQMINIVATINSKDFVLIRVVSDFLKIILRYFMDNHTNSVNPK